MEHKHEWVVFGTAKEEVCLLLQCVECGSLGTVDDPSKKEWLEAFIAPSSPYRWDDESRVRMVGKGEPFVLRVDKTAKACDCPFCAEDVEYERLPAEIMDPDSALTPEDRKELGELADLVSKSNLCSTRFRYFILSYPEETGKEPTGAVKEIASRIERSEEMGLHFSPSVVARVMRAFAKG